MNSRRTSATGIVLLVLGIAALAAPVSEAADDPLPSWNDGPSKQAILDFVGRVTTKGGKDYVPPEERIATFDNDGTLWSEQPIYFQAIFTLDRVKALAPEHPEWKETQPFKAVLENDKETLGRMSMKDVMALSAATHAGVTEEEFSGIVKAWLATAKHPRFDRPYTELTFAPMVELLDYLRANDFRVWICSGGGTDFMRVFAEEVYGVPPEQVIGSTGKRHFEVRDGRPVIVKDPGMARVNDKEGKPVGISLQTGRRPILAAGNSDGDLQMLEYTDDGEGPALMLLVHHDDAEREWAYDRESHIGKLDKALDEAKQRGWIVTSMKKDWKRIYAFEETDE